MNKIIRILFLLFITIILGVSCTTTKEVPVSAFNDFSIVETDERMFWEIHGMAEDGTPSTVYILGTIHIGDDQLYPLSDYVVSALDYSDRIVAEVSAEDVELAEAEVTKKLLEGINLSRNIYESFTDAEVEYLYSLYDAESIESLKVFEPWILMSLFQEYAIANTNLSQDQGLDINLFAYAREEGRTVEGLESLETQLDLVTFSDFTYEEQILIMKEIIADSIELDPSIELQKLYNFYLANDKEGLSEIANMPPDVGELEARYYKILLDDRNKNWAESIVTYLNEGGSTFIYAGVGHFTGENNVFDFLKVYQ